MIPLKEMACVNLVWQSVCNPQRLFEDVHEQLRPAELSSWALFILHKEKQATWRYDSSDLF